MFAVLCERAGAGWPATYTVTTGRGGMHLYFRHPPRVKPRNTQGGHGGLGWLVDTRAHGGYVVAAGSVVDGRPYTAWDTDPAPLPNVWVGTSIESDEYTWRADKLRQAPAAVRFLSLEPLLGPLPSLDLAGIDWVIIGGESGPRHRPLDLNWVRDIRDRCVRQRIALFFKQVGGTTPKAGGRLLDGRTWDQYPDTGQAVTDHD